MAHLPGSRSGHRRGPRLGGAQAVLRRAATRSGRRNRPV